MVDNEFGKCFGERLLKIMSMVGFDKKELARAIDENEQTIGYWLRGGKNGKRLPTLKQFSKLLETLQNRFPNANIDANFFFKNKDLTSLKDGEAISMNQLLDILKIELKKFDENNCYDGIYSTSEKFFFEKKDLLDLYYEAAKKGTVRRVFVLDGDSVSKELSQIMKDHVKNGIETRFVFKKNLPITFQILDVCLFYSKDPSKVSGLKEYVFVDIPIKNQFFSHSVFSNTKISVDDMKRIFKNLWEHKNTEKFKKRN